MSSKRRASELYHNSMHQRNDSKNDEFSIVDGGNIGDYSNDQSLYKSVHMEQLESSREHDRLIEEYENKVNRGGI